MLPKDRESVSERERERERVYICKRLVAWMGEKERERVIEIQCRRHCVCSSKRGVACVIERGTVCVIERKREGIRHSIDLLN